MRILSVVLILAALTGGAASAQNAIVIENQLTGAPPSEWDLDGPGSTSLEGFATDISVNHGQTVDFKIRSGTSNWRVDIYRLGYYQGNGARLVATRQMSASRSQPSPVVDPTTGEVDAGNWSVTMSWAIPADAVSGVYIAKLTDQNDSSNQNHIPFIVRADESTSDIVFQTSDTTWQAYNGWGGANLYGGNGPGGDSAPGRAYKVSYNRPICTRDFCGTVSSWTDFVFGAEFSAFAWLEQNGYDVSYIAGVDTARSATLLLHHKVFMTAGHDEYWDTQARSNVEAARGAGVNLAFLSGNEVFWKTRWESSIDGATTPNRTLICYKETRHNAPLDPLDVSPSWMWTGTWRDPRGSPPADGGRPENALTGTMTQVDAYRSDAIAVPYEMSRLRFWRNTANVSVTPSGGVTSLTPNILGYEWDGAPDNGFSPAGLIYLSSTTSSVGTFFLDYGAIVGDGTATHHLTLYRDQASGALVFGAGTVFWAWGLFGNIDGPSTPTDPNIQQATLNLLADMGVQPTTLQSGLVPATKSTDLVAPLSTISTPANGATFQEGQPVTISGVASDASGRVAGVEVSVDGGTTWRRASGSTNWSYVWNATAGSTTILSRATDDSLNTEAPSTSISVTVASGGSSLFAQIAVPEKATSDDPNSVELGVRFSSAVAGTISGLRFYKNFINIGAHTAHLWDSSGNLLASATFTNETAHGWQIVDFAAPVHLTVGAAYTASYHTNGFYSASFDYFGSPLVEAPLTAPVNAGVYAYGGAAAFPAQSYSASNYWVDVMFKPDPAVSAPSVTSATSVNGVVGAPFSYEITASNNPTSFNATGLPAGLSIDSGTGVISGTPSAGGVTSIVVSATNAAGTGSAMLSVTVNAAGSTLFTASSTPAIVTVADPNSVELGMKFVASTAGVVTAIKFYKGPQNTGAHTAHLWSAAGALLASATFVDESASGWQTVALPTSVSIAANTTYIVSYHTSGNYSASGGFFASAYTFGSLSAPASGTSGGNGVYAYGSSVAFPTSTYNANNYWVDIMLQ
ncbi:hypothetical+protein [Methylocapsa aurea]|uniref:N,N-dimethylformamidase beta subunit family domain-containing protein n=1 Tax=Methylocapsa aurea TaxID=663610 RepID=UPI003D18BC9F